MNKQIDYQAREEKRFFSEMLENKLLHSIPVYKSCDLCLDPEEHIQVLETGDDGRGGKEIWVVRLCSKHNKMYANMYREKLLKDYEARTQQNA